MCTALLFWVSQAIPSISSLRAQAEGLLGIWYLSGHSFKDLLKVWPPITSTEIHIALPSGSSTVRPIRSAQPECYRCHDLRVADKKNQGPEIPNDLPWSTQEVSRTESNFSKARNLAFPLQKSSWPLASQHSGVEKAGSLE